MLKKLKYTFYIFLLFPFSLAAMDLSRTSDPVYKDIQDWATRGLIHGVPNFRPYPLVLVQSWLNEVIEKGNSEDVLRAQGYMSEISPELKPHYRVFHSSLFAVGYPNHDYDGTTGFYFTHNGYFSENVGFSGFFGALGIDWATLTAYPEGQATSFDFIMDDSSVEVLGRNYLLALSSGGVLSFGTPDLYAQVGINRHGFGPFSDGVVFSPSAKEAASVNFTWRTENLIYTKYLLALNASKDNNSLPITNSGAFYPDKFLSGHSFQFFLWDFLELSFYENIVFGQRLDPYYLIPVLPLLYSSIYTGLHDNILVGGTLVLRLPWAIRTAFQFHADDLSFLKLFAGQLDGKSKIAAQAGLEWIPDLGILHGIEVGYSLATPYTFTHSREFIQGGDADQSLINYVNYTHGGSGLVSLEPNSDRFDAALNLYLNPQLEVRFTGRIQRHGNASDDGYTVLSEDFIGTTDGGFNDSGYISPGGDHKFNTNRFLNQAIIETLYQFGFQYSLGLNTPIGEARIKGGFLFEYGKNRRANPMTGAVGTASFSNDSVPVLGNDGTRNYVTIEVSFQL